jgi:hypothetical protein
MLNHLFITNFIIEPKLNLSEDLFATRFTVETTFPFIENSTSPNFCPSKIGALNVSSSFIS